MDINIIEADIIPKLNKYIKYLNVDFEHGSDLVIK